MPRAAEIILVVAAIILLGAALWMLAAQGRTDVPLAGYVTSLGARTASQRHNADLAARRLDGTLIPAGGSLSFNRRVGPWTADCGYRRAPVSYDGELLPEWGGGVCQTSSTLYNAALLAGLEIAERHRHEWPPRYVPPGRDAAVAYPGIDLIVRNPYPWPVRVVARSDAGELRVSILGRHKPLWTVAVSEEVRSTTAPARVTETDPQSDRSLRVVNRGYTGCEVAVFRSYRSGGQLVRRELVSVDQYAAMTRIVRVGR